MKILLVNIFYNEEGGAQKSTTLLAEQLVKEGHEVSVYSIDTDKPVNEKKNGVQIFRRNTTTFDLNYIFKTRKNRFKHLFYKFFEVFNKSAERNFEEILDVVQPDVIHFNCLSGMSLGIIEIAKSRGIKTVLTLRDYWLETPWGTKNNFIVNGMNRRLEPKVKRALSFVDIVTAPSAFTLNHFIEKEYFNSSHQICEVVENAVTFSQKNLKKIIDEKRSIVHNMDTRFLFVGSILRQKGIFKMVEAFKELSAYPNITLDIVGKGADLQELKAEIESDSRIKYLGFKSNPDLNNIYRSADVLVVPSDWDEPFGRVAIEGNSNGLPVIGSNRGGIPEIVHTTKGGEVFDISSISTFVEVMKKFIEMPNYNIYFDSILETIDTYQIEKQSEKFVKLYQK
ncbi:glycosyltransferase family 4 protein [Streptococcus merionis]|uniref:Glycoside hydrolase family protein n=1 Tax=Streptococcus merionis TaxID=400065 RepID=A0A239SS02_9STRE|nr:glycosyltransferase family 4 protein [Streptococcus merionis]SNU88265.1 glycoside hydrolase family protein [Streptococcus merionis]